jgi:hypothetical protein
LECSRKRLSDETLSEASQNEYVIYQTTRALRESTLREWSVMSLEAIEAVWQYLLQFAIHKSKLVADRKQSWQLVCSLSNYVTAELLQAVAIILKRGTFDTKTGETDLFYSSIEQMVASGDLRLVSLFIHFSRPLLCNMVVQQGLACQAIQSLCTEYCTSWRSGDVGITWDFHMRSKRCFEVCSDNDWKHGYQNGFRQLDWNVCCSYLSKYCISWSTTFRNFRPLIKYAFMWLFHTIDLR